MKILNIKNIHNVFKNFGRAYKQMKKISLAYEKNNNKIKRDSLMGSFTLRLATQLQKFYDLYHYVDSI